MSQPIAITLADLERALVAITGTIEDDLVLDFARKLFDWLIVHHEKALLAESDR